LSKIREIESVVGPGARTNKYRVLIPFLGREVDIQCHDITSPGRTMGVAEVFLKGRKYQLAGDRADEGTFTMTIYNDPNLVLRRLFLVMIDGMQSFNTPGSISGFSSNISDSLTQMNTSTISGITDVFDQISSNLNNIGTLTGMFGVGRNLPWYQSDMTVQQLDHDGNVVSNTILHSAFITDVSALEYQDEVGEISTTTLVFNYTGVTYV